MLEKHLVYAGESPPRNFQNAKIKKRSMKAEDPMSHRIIEKRRRDRMNNCLADLSRLIPPEYLKKGRGRIEKTEIIEMAIKHMRHLQSIIASTRFNENSNSSVPSPPIVQTVARDIPAIPKTVEYPSVLKHYKMGYLECISEAMHFLVEIQGYFAGDSLCVQMTNHLHKHCDNILKGNSLNFLKKSLGETTYSDSSTSPINVTYNNSPPSVGLSNSIDSSSDENRWNQSFDVRVPEDGKIGPGFCSIRKYPDSCYSSGKHSEVYYARCVNSAESENVSDSEPHYQSFFKWRNNDVRREESNSNFEASGNQQKNYQVYQNMEESGNGLSQLKEMLTSSINTQMKDHSNKVVEAKGNVSPLSNTSGYETSSGTTIQTFKTSPNKRMDSGQTDLSDGDNHYLMYKFKNNIQQRFSKENGENAAECVVNENLQQLKKAKSEECQKCPDPLVKQKLSSVDRMDIDEERLFKFNADFESRKKVRYVSESENHQPEDGITSRLNFGRKAERARKLEELTSYQHQTNPKPWVVSPNLSVPFFGPTGEFKPLCRELSEYSSSLNNSYHNPSLPPPETGQGVPIFALHAKGSFYIPLTLDQTVLAPFLTVLGITKTDEALSEKTVLHPVTISVNFQSHFVQ